MIGRSVDQILKWVARAIELDAVTWIEFADHSPFVCWIDDQPDSYLAVWPREGDAEQHADALDDVSTVRTTRVGGLAALMAEHGVAGVSVNGEWLVERLATLALLTQGGGDGAFRAALGPHEDVIIRPADAAGRWRICSVPVMTGGFDFGDVVSLRIDDVLGATVDTVVRPADRLHVRIASRPESTDDDERELHGRLLALGPGQGALVAGVGQVVSYEEPCDALAERVQATLARFPWAASNFELGRGRRLDAMLAAARGQGAAVVPGGTLGAESPPEPVNDAQRNVVDAVRRFGWHGVSVPNGLAWDGPDFYYTVGLHASYGHPELVIVGLVGSVPHLMARGAVEEISEGRGFSPGMHSEALLESHEVRFEAVDVSAVPDWLVLAHWFYGDEQWSALQVLLPDQAGRFADEDGYDNSSSSQEILDAPAD